MGNAGIFHLHSAFRKSGDFFSTRRNSASSKTTNERTNEMEAIIKAFAKNYEMSENDLSLLREIGEVANSVSNINDKVKEYNELQDQYVGALTEKHLLLYKVALMVSLNMSQDSEDADLSVFQLESAFAQLLEEQPDLTLKKCWAGDELGKWYEKRLDRIKAGKLLTEDWAVRVEDQFQPQEEYEDGTLDNYLTGDDAPLTYAKAILITKKTTAPKKATPAPAPAKTAPAKKTTAVAKSAPSKAVVVGEYEYDLADREFNPRGFKKYEHLTAGFFKTHYTYEILDEIVQDGAVWGNKETTCCARMVRDGAGTLYPKIRMPFWANPEEVGATDCDNCYTFRFPTDLMNPSFLADFTTQIAIQAKGETPYWDKKGFYKSFVEKNQQYWDEKCADWKEKLGITEEDLAVQECD